MKNLTEDHKKNIGAATKATAEAKRNHALEDQAADLYRAGFSLSEVGGLIGVPVATVHRWIRRKGVSARASGDWHRGRPWTEERRKHHPKKPERPADAPRGYEILTQRAAGNKSLSKRGYVIVAIGRKKRQYEHIIVAEKAIGRRLNKGEVVHHINCIRNDNRPENLLVCTIAYHLRLHAAMRKHPYWSAVEAHAKTITYHQ